MISTDYILSLLDCQRTAEEQNQGLRLANCISNINVFIMPHCEEYGKNVWKNCALIICEKSDDNLFSYISDLMFWLQDMNWPGAVTVFERLKRFENKSFLNRCCNEVIKFSQALEHSQWERNLHFFTQTEES